MKGAVATLLLCLPTLARAEGTTSQGFSFLTSFLQMIAALTIVVGLILLTRHFSSKLFGGTPTARFASKHIRLVETRYIAPKKALILIEVAGEYLLLSSTEDGLTLIKQVNVLEEIEVLEDAGLVRGRLFGLFRRDADGRKG
ncbi:MAG: flagellar biosynthetic protein FliO [Deltaproteobacteria bacterium]|nr:flagellar biosynthetic protein FliO [Deltaproteobacteria bacterium]